MSFEEFGIYQGACGDRLRSPYQTPRLRRGRVQERRGVGRLRLWDRVILKFQPLRFLDWQKYQVLLRRVGC